MTSLVLFSLSPSSCISSLAVLEATSRPLCLSDTSQVFIMSNNDFYAGPRFDLPGAMPAPGLENRPAYLPRIFIVDKHVQYPAHTSGMIYVYLEDIADAIRMIQIRNFTKGLKTPSGTKEYLTKECGESIYICTLLIQ